MHILQNVTNLQCGLKRICCTPGQNKCLWLPLTQFMCSGTVHSVINNTEYDSWVFDGYNPALHKDAETRTH